MKKNVKLLFNGFLLYKKYIMDFIIKVVESIL